MQQGQQPSRDVSRRTDNTLRVAPCSDAIEHIGWPAATILSWKNTPHIPRQEFAPCVRERAPSQPRVTDVPIRARDVSYTHRRDSQAAARSHALAGSG